MVNKRLLELAARQKNPSLPKKKTEKPKESDSKLTQILERDLDGKPKITLNELEKTVVNTPTQEEYWNLMRVYECGGWVWFLGHLPTQNDRWNEYEEKTCIDARNSFTYGDVSDFEEEKIISTQKFYNLQNITQENINEINQWFDNYGK